MEKKNSQIRILIADGDSICARKLGDYLSESGFEVKTLQSSHGVQKRILEWRPHVIFVDLMFPGFYAQSCLKFLNERKLLGPGGIRVVVTSSHNNQNNVMGCLKDGAEDFLVKPLNSLDVLHRLMLLMKIRRFDTDDTTDAASGKLEYYFRIMDLLVKAAGQKKPLQEVRYELIQMLSLSVKAVRTSIVECNSTKDEVAVTASSDDQSLTHLPLDLGKYPELQYVLRTEKPLYIENINDDKRLATIQNQVKSIHFNSMIVLPIMDGWVTKGCLSIRMPKEYSTLSVWDVKVAQLAAQLIAITWKFSESTKKTPLSGTDKKSS